MAELTAPDPERVHALLVGIEHYPRVKGRELPGAAADAMRLARWLRRRGVPGANIRLLLGPVEASWADLNVQARDLGLDIETVISRDQILDKLAPPRTPPEGDLLYVYWGGHGVLDRGDRRLLVCPDASDADQRCLDLMDLREYLTRSEVARCRRQVFLVDTCATFVPAGGTRPAVAALPTGNRLPVEQFMLLAAAPGQAAKQRGAARTGAFSTAVLDWLEEHSPSLATDLDALVAHVKEHFTGHRLGNRQLQTPVTLVIQPVGGDVEIWQRPDPPGVKRAKRSPADRSGGAGVWAGGGVLALVAMVAIVAMFLSDRRDAGQKDEAESAKAPVPSGAPVIVPSPSPSTSASASRPSSPAASSGTPTPPAQVTGAPLKEGERCASFLPTSDAPGVEEQACVWKEGSAVYMRAYVRASTRSSVKVKVYLWLSLRDGNKYLFPPGGATSQDVTVRPQAEPEAVTTKVAIQLKPGTAYEVHVSTKLPNIAPPNAPDNPAVTGHGQWFTY